MRGLVFLALAIGPALAAGPGGENALDLSPYARKADLPAPATVTPPGTAVNSALGSAVQYARADHTHATSVQRARMAITPVGQPVRWTFAKPYDPGTVPVVTCTAQNTPGAALPFVVNTSGDPTATYADIVIYRNTTQVLATTLTALPGTTISVFAAAPVGTVVNCQAAKATQ